MAKRQSSGPGLRCLLFLKSSNEIGRGGQVCFASCWVLAASLMSQTTGFASAWLFGVDEDVEEFADGTFPGHRVTQRLVDLNVVAVPAPVPFLDHVGCLAQVDHEPVGGALGDIQGGGQVSKAGLGVMGDE